MTGGQLERCRKSQTCPKITATFTDTEYWQSLMALNTIDAAGEKDVAIPPEVRLYFFAGTQHSGGDLLKQPPFVQPKPPLACQLPANRNSFFPMQRALLVGLRDWVVNGKEPPASVYPTIARKSLVPVAQIKFPYVPASEFSARGVAAQRVHLDRGPAFHELDITGVMAEPPHAGAAYPLLLPQVDADGNHIDGLRNTAVQVPLGTYTGWNVRKGGFSEGDSCDLLGAYIPFFRTKAEREAAKDPRPSLEERYPTHECLCRESRRRRGETRRRPLPARAGRRAAGVAGEGSGGSLSDRLLRRPIGQRGMDDQGIVVRNAGCRGFIADVHGDSGSRNGSGNKDSLRFCDRDDDGGAGPAI